MYKKKKNIKLDDWREKYSSARNAYTDNIARMQKNQKQYDGELQPEGKKVDPIFNFTFELVESAIDNGVPQPKVEPDIPSEKGDELARIIENMIKGEMKRLEFDVFNDEDERTTKICGGDIGLIEWDNSITTHDTVGALSIRPLPPIQFIPQEGVYHKKYMDYMFLTFEDTKARLEKRYSVNVDMEGIDQETAEPVTSDELATQVLCFYRNDRGNIGCFSWCGDTVLIDEEDYQARTQYVCAKCGRGRAIGEMECACGSKSYKRQNLYEEELQEDIEQYDGTVIPAMDYARDDDGEFLYEDVEEPVTEINPVTGMKEPVYRQIFDDSLNVMGEEPLTQQSSQPYMVPTKIPYYVPGDFPVCIRKNISTAKNVLGKSDVEVIYTAQDKTDKISTRLGDKVINGGRFLTKPKSLNFNFSNGQQIVEINKPDEKNMIDSIDLSFSPSGDIEAINTLYYWAKSMLGINESSQGKEDSTATSGRAKEAQISRALGRQQSKVVMKEAFYRDIFRSVFQFMLAYADEPRTYKTKDEEGRDEEVVFSRYDFLQQDDNGKWYYNDQFTFSVDSNGTANEDRQAVLEMMKEDYNAGLYGDPATTEAKLNYWRDREMMNYPNAGRQVKRWQKKYEEEQQMISQQQERDQFDMLVQQLVTEGIPEEEAMEQAAAQLGINDEQEVNSDEVQEMQL